MTTLVMVVKDGLACMAAETLSSFGERKQPARYVARPEKIIQVDETYVGIVSWAVHQDVLASVFANGFKMPQIVGERDLFELSRTLHNKLKKDYFLNPHEHRDDPYESSQMTLFIMNRHGLFALSSLRAMDRFK